MLSENPLKMNSCCGGRAAAAIEHDLDLALRAGCCEVETVAPSGLLAAGDRAPIEATGDVIDRGSHSPAVRSACGCSGFPRHS